VVIFLKNLKLSQEQILIIKVTKIQISLKYTEPTNRINLLVNLLVILNRTSTDTSIDKRV
jgi:hypothetical protein